jgi:lysosomal acid lipase/cholesteryl ester hydrolase
MLFIIGGPDTKNLNTSHIPVYASHGPSGTSVNNMVHFMQCGRSNQFQTYNYGSAEQNQLHYNQTIPPIYSINVMQKYHPIQ